MKSIKHKFKIKKNVNIIRSKEGLILENNTNDEGYVVIAKPFFCKKKKNFLFSSKVKVIKGENPQIILINRRKEFLRNLSTNCTFGFENPNSLFFLAIKVKANSKVQIEDLKIYKSKETISTEGVSNDFNASILLMVPGYPSEYNKYLFGFVHTRVKEYQKNGLSIDVAYVSEENEYYTYEYDGVLVHKISFFDMRSVLQVKHYAKIIVHFFNEKFSQILDATNTFDSDIYLFTHGSDILYRDINKLTCPYFTPVANDSEYQLNYFKDRDKTLNKYNNMPNVKFIFPSKWAKNESEKQNSIKYNNYEIMPTFIDGETFKYNEKNEDARTKILIIRKYDNVNTYSIDIDVLTILELSRRPYFKELEFNIYGDGYYHEELLKPLKNFDNVHIYKKFLTHEEIAEVHKENGIGLFATRYETQGVSAAEAMSSGLVVVSNKVCAVPEMFENYPELLAETEDYVGLANIIEKLYKDKKLFKKYSEQLSLEMKKKYDFDHTIKKELKLLNTELPRKEFKIDNKKHEKVLSIGIASYNVEKYLFNSVQSLLESKYIDDIEILIVNDGSKDNTAKIGREIEELINTKNNIVVKLIDKENGGHGSAINAAIKNATGKYFKLMDGDDYFDTPSLDTLIEHLKEDDEDLILNNYVEDWSTTCTLNPVHHYDFMIPGKAYNIEDLCFDNYGFTNWGPLLSTTTFKTKMLKDANFKISEHCFYVDMELNSIAFTCAKTVKFYPLDIYVYYLGRQGQSVSAASFKKNYKNHEHVTLRIIKDIYYGRELSENKRKYIKYKILKPLINGQYYITTEYFNSKKQFVEFDSKLKEYPEFYNDNEFIEKKLKKYRIMNGNCFYAIKKCVKFKSFVKNIFKR